MRLIDADALVEFIKDYPYGFRGMVVCDIAKQPTIEPKEMTDHISKSAIVDRLSEEAKRLAEKAIHSKGQAVDYYTGMKTGIARAAIWANGTPTVDDEWMLKHGMIQDADFTTIEQRRGKWIKDGVANSLYKCTACNDLCTVAGWANCIHEEQMYKTFKFCPNCGARMGRSEDE